MFSEEMARRVSVGLYVHSMICQSMGGYNMAELDWITSYTEYFTINDKSNKVSHVLVMMLCIDYISFTFGITIGLQWNLAEVHAV